AGFGRVGEEVWCAVVVARDSKSAFRAYTLSEGRDPSGWLGSGRYRGPCRNAGFLHLKGTHKRYLHLICAPAMSERDILCEVLDQPADGVYICAMFADGEDL